MSLSSFSDLWKSENWIFTSLEGNKVGFQAFMWDFEIPSPWKSHRTPPLRALDGKSPSEREGVDKSTTVELFTTSSLFAVAVQEAVTFEKGILDKKM